MTEAACLLLVGIVVLVLAEAAVRLRSLWQFFCSSRPFSGREVSLTCSLPGQGDHEVAPHSGPQPFRTSQGRLLSSPPPASGTADLESAGEDG
jgi:hypothetical protein